MGDDVQAQACCGAREAFCQCTEHGEHEVHRCPCGGAWRFDDNGVFHVVSFPDYPATPGDEMDA